MSALSEALKIGGAGLTQYGTARMQEEMQARRDAAMAKREENLARLRAQLAETAAGGAREFQAEEAEKGREFKREMTTSAQEYGTVERVAGQEFKAAESEKERVSREKIAGMKAEAKKTPSAANISQEKNRLQRERESYRKQMEGHTTWGILAPEYRAQFQAEGDKLIAGGDTAGIAANDTLKKLRKLDEIVQGAMQSPQAKGKTKAQIIELIMSNDKYRKQIGL